MSGSSSIKDRIFLLKNCYRIIFNSNLSKKTFLEKMSSDAINSEKLIVIHQSASKNKINIKKNMKISVLLPYKENFSPTYAGAVSLFINDTIKLSKYKNTTTVYGFTEYKNRFKSHYINIETSKRLFSSSNKEYVKKFISI